MANSQQLRETLLRTDEEFRRLTEQHQDLKTRLHTLSHQLSRNGTEDLEKATLKKRKLQLKDRMEEILRQRRSPTDLATIGPSI